VLGNGEGLDEIRGKKEWLGLLSREMSFRFEVRAGLCLQGTAAGARDVGNGGGEKE